MWRPPIDKIDSGRRPLVDPLRHHSRMSFATFVPDLIVGLLTGVVVGAVFIAYERTLTARREATEIRVHSTRLVQPLLLAVQRLEEPRYESPLQLPRRIDRALALVEASDLDRWNELADTPLIRALFEFRDAAWDLREDAYDLDVAIQRWQRLHETVPGTVAYGTAQLLEAPRQYLRELVPDVDARQELEEAAAAFRESRLVKRHARHFRKGRARTQRALDALHEVLVTEIRASRGERSSTPVASQ